MSLLSFPAGGVVGHYCLGTVVHRTEEQELFYNAVCSACAASASSIGMVRLDAGLLLGSRLSDASFQEQFCSQDTFNFVNIVYLRLACVYNGRNVSYCGR